jgi:CheY-like chemotaxis protein
LARKILLADDSVTAQNMGRKILTDAGYEVVTVNNGSAALKKIVEVKPDLIVLDVYMPGYSGLEVCQRIKENKDTSRIPVLLTVGKLEPFKPEEARRVRADGFVVKPFEASELLAALARLEDKVVPQPEPYKQGRFAKAVAAVDEHAGADKDESWKGRLRIPTGPAKGTDVGTEETAVAPGNGFRDLGTDVSGKKAKASRETEFERPIPAGLPADITPEEIAAITAAAARLSGAPTPIPEPAEATGPAVPESTGSAAGVEETSPVTFASAPEPPAADAGLSMADAGPSAAGSEANEPSAMSSSPASQDFQVSTQASENLPQEAPSEALASAEAPNVEAAAESAPAEIAVGATSADPASVPTAEATTPEITSSPQVPRAPAPPTADDEVMAALQSLMPVEDGASKNIAGSGDHAVPAALAAIAAEVDSAVLKAHAAGPRWIAEEVALAEDEASLSLEREMEQAYAAAAHGGIHATSAPLPASQASVSDTAAASAAAVAADPQVAEGSAAYAMAAGATDAGSVIAAPALTETISVQSEVAPREQVSDPAGVIESGTPLNEAASAVAEDLSAIAPSDAQGVTENQIAGGVEEMAANWKNIRDSIASGGAAKAAPAKENEEAPAIPAEKLEAEAPIAPAHAPSASDPKAIASIVDSVLAELRPRIVEEIARKLADPKKE